MQAVQIKMARAALGLSADQLAEKAGVSLQTITHLEEGTGVPPSDTQGLHLFLAASGIELIDDDGVRAKGEASHDFVSVENLTTDNDGGEG